MTNPKSNLTIHPLLEIRKKLGAELTSLTNIANPLQSSSNIATDFMVEGMADIRYPQKNKVILLTDLAKNLKTTQNHNKKFFFLYLNALKKGNIFLVDQASFDLTNISSVLQEVKEESKKAHHNSKIFILTNSVKLDFVRLLKLFDPYQNLPLTKPLIPFQNRNQNQSNNINTSMIGPYCVVGEEVTIGNNTTLTAHVYLGHGVTIGERVTIHPNVTIHSGTVIKDDVIIHSGTVIGGEGFGYEIDLKKKTRIKIPQIGNVIIHDEVEIGSNCTIDRATIGSTIINQRVKIDNLVQIAHNVEVGEDTVIVSQVGIAGSSRLGKGVILGGQVGVSDHAEIGDGAQVGAQSGVMPHTVVPAGAFYFGSPVMPYRERIKMELALKKLIQKS